jgi:tetratricopeptide (TPR) repeat protein
MASGSGVQTPRSASAGSGGTAVESTSMAAGGERTGFTSRALVLVGTVLVLPAVSSATARPDMAAGLEQAMASAEAALRAGRPDLARARYDSALVDGWLLLGALDLADAAPQAAQQAFREAMMLSGADTRASQALASVDVSVGETDDAVEILTRLVNASPKDVGVRRFLAQTLVRAGQAGRAVAVLEEARSMAPEDLEVAYDLANGYLQIKKPDAAQPLFAQIAKARPMAQTHVLIGRAYRDAGDDERARAELREALRLNPEVRRGHYYLGTVLVADWQGGEALEEAIQEFRAELALAPGDALANVQLGMALVELRRLDQALQPLEIAARAPHPEARALYYLGRCHLGLGHPSEAEGWLRRALDVGQKEGVSPANLGSIHNLLGQALRRLGRDQEAAPHFADASRLAARSAAAARAQYQADAAPAHERPAPTAPLVEDAPLAALAEPQRADLRRRVTAAMARAYLNLGVAAAQGGRLDAAAVSFQKAADLDGDMPRVQYSLGATRFKLEEYGEALGPLRKARAAAPDDVNLRRMLALASFHVKDYAQAAELLEGDDGREDDPSLLLTYGLALVHVGRAKDAEAVFARLFYRYGDSADLDVVLGQAHAQEGNFEAAIQSLTHALALKPDAAEANGTLGAIYLEQGRLVEAENALRAELHRRPGDLGAKQNLAVVLEAQQRPEEAMAVLRSILESKPDLADARYLLGKVLLAQGDVAGALEQLEAGVRLAPEDANIHYQLARAYQRDGRNDRAEKELEVFREIKARRAPPGGGVR